MTDIPRPQDTGSTTIEVDSEGVANGLLSMIAGFYDVEYDEEARAYYVLTESRSQDAEEASG